MTRLLLGLTAATQNIESVYAYLRIIDSDHLDPIVMPVSQLRALLRYVKKVLKVALD